MLVALVMIAMTGCTGASLPLPPVGLETQVVSGTEAGAAATKLAAAKRKAGIKERTRMTTSCKEGRVSEDWSERNNKEEIEL